MLKTVRVHEGTSPVLSFPTCVVSSRAYLARFGSSSARMPRRSTHRSPWYCSRLTPCSMLAASMLARRLSRPDGRGHSRPVGT